MQKTNFKTRLLALLTAVFMVVMCVPFAAFADEAIVTVSFNRLNTDPDWTPYLTKDLCATQPEVVAPALPDGYNAWTSDTTSIVLKAGEKLTYDQVKANRNVSFNPAKVEEEKRELKVTFTVDKNLGKFTDPAGAEKVDFTIAEDSQEQFNIPTVEAVDGYKFVGWTSDDTEINWDSNAKSFGVSSSWPDKVEIKAVFEKKESKKLNIKFTVDAALGTITNPAGAKEVTFNDIEADTDQQFVVPTVEGKNGYKFVGWASEDGTVKWDANTKTFGVSANWPENLEIKAVFEEVKSDNNGSSSSTSSSSSSSNKTTTASNEKQVVKAAAAPANTTKVLPKTGASNVAPLLGGSLAVVALLMGYGVYSLVLRKKD